MAKKKKIEAADFTLALENLADELAGFAKVAKAEEEERRVLPMADRAELLALIAAQFGGALISAELPDATIEAIEAHQRTAMDVMRTLRATPKEAA